MGWHEHGPKTWARSPAQHENNWAVLARHEGRAGPCLRFRPIVPPGTARCPGPCLGRPGSCRSGGSLVLISCNFCHCGKKPFKWWYSWSVGRAWAGTARRWPDVLLGRAGPWFQVLGPARHGPVKFRALSARHGSARSTMGPCRAVPARPNFQLYWTGPGLNQTLTVSRRQGEGIRNSASPGQGPLLQIYKFYRVPTFQHMTNFQTLPCGT